MNLSGYKTPLVNKNTLTAYSTVVSGNWAGVAESDTAHNFTSVGAMFNMPTSLACNSTADLIAGWVGLNGYINSYVEQTGVVMSCATGSPTFQAWYEMYPAYPVYLSTATYPVSPGDTIIASVSNNVGSYTLNIWDYTKGWTYSTTQVQSGQTTATSAEAVVEVPSGYSNPGYGTLTFAAMGGNMTPGGNGTVFAQAPSPTSGYPPIYTIYTGNSASGPYRATSTGMIYNPSYPLSPYMQVSYVGP